MSAPAVRVPGVWHTFLTAARLGWKIESNWTDPFLFLVYSILKPLSHAAILVVMIMVVSGGRTEGALFNYIVIGNACYTWATSVIVGVSFGVLDDRERYKTLKYLCLAPIPLPLYLIGRGAAQFLMGCIAVALTLLLAALVFHLPIRPGEIRWGWLLASLLFGIVSLALIGLLVGGMTLLMAHQVEVVGYAVAGSLYLVSGAIFPLEVLPSWLRWIGYGLPLTWWLELTRRALVGNAAAASPSMAAFGDASVLAILAGQTVVLAVVATLGWKWAYHRARERGLLDKVTNY
ncbi:MAG TPA: ABC transporter permease [Candidatus Eisenbacteria bacterium]